MKTIIKVLIGAIITFFTMRQCDTPNEVKTITKTKTEYVEVPVYSEITRTVKVPVNQIKYYKKDSLVYVDKLVAVETPTLQDTSVAFIPYQDSSVTISDSITITGQILDFKRKVTILDKTPDTIKVTTIKKVFKPIKQIKYYVGVDSDFNNLFQPSFGLSYDQPKYQISLGYRPITKVVEARFFLPLIKLK